jgi:hypothetical protein
MHKKGHAFVGKDENGYEFKPSAAKDVNYKIDYRKFVRDSEYENYLSIFEDSGWVHVAGSKLSGNQKSATGLAVGTVSQWQGCPSRGGI